MIGLADVEAAEARIGAAVRRTPLERSDALSAASGREVLLKLESLQRTGSFKVRGAMNAVAALDPSERARGIVTASAGNHGLGVALAGRELGVAVRVVVPAGAPETKRRRIERLGAELITVRGGYDEAHGEAEALAAASGAVYIHAFSDPLVVAGQGTVGLEIVRARPDVGTLLVPVGGGGLIGGVGLVARALTPEARVVGVQSEHTSAMYHSLEEGEPVAGEVGPTLCDGLAGDVDERSLALAAAVVDEMVLVPEALARAAVRRLYVEEGLVAEGSAAVAAAALWGGLLPDAEGPVAAVLTGANIDGPVLAEILAAPAAEAGRDSIG